SLSSLAVSLLISLPLGTISAVRRGTCLDSLGMAIAMLGISVPNFWLAYLLIMLFSLHLDLLPVAGFGSGGDLEHTLLPALTLGLAASAVTNRVVRASMVEALSQDYTMAAIARGLPRRSVVLRHAMRNALLPIITVIGLNFSYLINGSAVVEAIFAWPGMGNLMVRSIYDRDYPLILGCMLFVALLMLILNLAVDLCCYYLNPRLRYAREN
ncbi:MAG: ABC transporter permease, partial [Methanothrix sp.]|nr:ABC transporter permease [Methanothrix sp.]